MDSAYLKENVGPALTAAMTAMIVEQPKDSVEVSVALAHQGSTTPR